MIMMIVILESIKIAGHRDQELIMWRGEYLMLYSPVIDDCAEVKRLPFRVTWCLSGFNHKSFIASFMAI